MPAARLIDSIQDIIQWGGSFSPSIARLIAQAFQKSSDSPLTKRETEVLQLIADGKTRSLVAKQLFIDMETVKTHIKNIYLKLDVHSRSEAIRMARAQRFIR
jgi:DNA-binding NarL/FixJ family response regulator